MKETYFHRLVAIAILILVTSTRHQQIIRLKDSNIEVSVKSVSRLKLYQALLINFGLEVEEINSSQISINKLVENMADFLDEKVQEVDFIKEKITKFYDKLSDEEEYKKYLSDNFLTDAQLENLKEKYILSFVQSLTCGEGSKKKIFEEAALTVNEKEAELDCVIGRINSDKVLKFTFDNYKSHICQLLHRLSNDRKIVYSTFLKEEEFKLNDIVVTDSDVHKIGGGVSILEFTHKEDLIKVVYKNSSVLMDFCIVGDTEGMEEYINELAKEEKKFLSFAEIMNNKIPASELKIKTYKILPREVIDEVSSSRIAGAYGYIKFIGKGSPEIPQTVNEVTELLRQIESKENVKDDQITNLFQETYYNNLLSNKNKNKEILENEQEIVNYSIHFGYILMIANILSSTDLHSENVIMSKKEPYIIDLENTASPLSGEAINCLLDKQEGSFSHKSEKVTIVTLEGRLGRPYKIYFQYFNSNVVFKKHKSEYVRPQLDQISVLKAMKTFSKSAIEVKEDIYEWKESRLVSNLIFRYVPLSTMFWVRLLYQPKDKVQEAILNYPEYKTNKEYVKYYMLFTENVVENLSKGIIPAFYSTLKSDGIFDASGVQLTLEKENELQNALKKGVFFKKVKKIQFFDETPLKEFENRLNSFLLNEEAIKNSFHGCAREFQNKFKELTGSLIV
jgi:hypothetical protein